MTEEASSGSYSDAYLGGAKRLIPTHNFVPPMPEPLRTPALPSRVPKTGAFHARAFFWVPLALCLAFTGCIKRPERDTSIDVGHVRTLVERATEMNNSGDIEGYMGLFDEGFVYMAPGRPAVTDREELLQYVTAAFTQFDADFEVKPEEIVVTGDYAIVRTTITGTAVHRESGQSGPVRMKEMLICTRHPEGGWRISRLIGNHG